jgi:integrase
MLQARLSSARSVHVFFCEDGCSPVTRFTVRGQRVASRKAMHVPADFVIHSHQHTGTRVGESGAGAFEIMRAAGHSSVRVSQKYVHPSPEAMEWALERLEAMNAQAAKRLSEGRERQLPAAVSAIVG